MINIALLTRSRASMKFFPAGRGKRAEGQAGRLLHLRGQEGQAPDALLRWKGYQGPRAGGLQRRELPQYDEAPGLAGEGMTLFRPSRGWDQAMAPQRKGQHEAETGS